MVQGRSRESKILPAMLVVVGVILMAVSFVFSSTSTAQNDMWMDHLASTLTSYTATNMLIAIVGSFLFTSGLMYLFLRQEYEPLPQSVMPTVLSTGFPSGTGTPLRTPTDPAIQTESRPEFGSDKVGRPSATVPPATPSAAVASAPDDGHQPAHYLALRLLSGDERVMFKAIMDSGGEALQKDLILKTKMSDAKVSRVIDRLEEKGVITKTRFGMTNKVCIDLGT